LARKLDIKRVSQAYVMTPRPTAAEQRPQLISMDGHPRERLQAIPRLCFGLATRSVQSAKRRKHLGIKMRRSMDLTVAQPSFDSQSKSILKQSFNNCGRIHR